MKTSALMKTLTSVVVLFCAFAAKAEMVTPEPPPPVDPSIGETTPTNHLRYGLFFSSPIKGCAFPGVKNAALMRSLCVSNGKMLKSNTTLLHVSDAAVSNSLQALSSRVQAGDSVLIYFGGLRSLDKRQLGETLSALNFVAALSKLPSGVKVAVIAEDADLAIQFVSEAMAAASECAATIGWCAVDCGYEGVCRNQVYEWGEVRSSQSTGMTSFVNYLSSGTKDGSADTNQDGLISVREACGHAAVSSQTNVVEILREPDAKRYWRDEQVYPSSRVAIEGDELLAELCLGASDANRSTMWTADPLVFEPADLGSVMEAASLDRVLSVAGGVPPYEFEEVLPDSGVSRLPLGISLDPSGRFVGYCHRAGTYDFEIDVIDDKLSVKTAQFSLTVTENPNRPPVLDSAFPAVPWVRLTSPGRAQEFSVSATDPEGAALAYCWTIDGEPIAGATGASLVLAYCDIPDDDEHVLTCTVSDGVWTDSAAHSWTLWREAFEDVKAETVDGYTWYHQDGSIIAVTPQPVGKVTVPSLFYDEVVHFGVETNFNRKTGGQVVRVYDEPVTERVENVFCEISGAVFNGCRGLTEVVLPQGIGGIAEDAFDGSPDLKRISMPVGGNGCYFTRDGVLYEGDLRGGCTLVRVPEGHEASSFDGLVGPRVEGIYEHAFLNCAKLGAIEVNTFSADAASFTDYTGCSSFTAFVWKGPKPRMGEDGWFVRNGALCYGYAYSEDGYGEFTLRKVPAGLESFTVDSSIRWIDSMAFVGTAVRELVFESTDSYTLEELFGNLPEILVGWPDDGFLSPIKRVVYRSSGSDSYFWKTFIRNFQNDYPFADVDFVESREAWGENWEWEISRSYDGDLVSASVNGWHFGVADQPSGAVTLPAFAYSEEGAFDPSSGQYVMRKSPLALAVEEVWGRTFFGMEDVTSITFPYTIQRIDWGWGGEDCDLSNVGELVFEGRIPEGFYELVAAAPNLRTVVYSANPRYCEEWESITNEFEGITFVKGAEPAEPQFEFECGGEAHLVGVWPTKGEVKVPAVWNACPVRGIYSDAFAEATEMTKLLLPASIWEFDEYMLEEAVALEEIEVYQPTRAEFAKMAVEEWMWDEEAGKSYKVLRPDYGETFDFWKYDTGIWHYTSEDGALFAEYETWFWDEERGEDVPGSWRRLVKCPAAKVAFDFANDVHEISDCALAGGNHAVCFNDRPYAPDCLDSALCVNTDACTVMYPYYGGANGDWYGYPWSGFVRDFKSSYPEALVMFEPYFLPDAKEDYEWRGYCGAPGEGATLSGLTLGSVRNPTGAVTIPATFDGQPVARIEVDDAFACFGTVTSIRFPYTLCAIWFDSSRAAFGAVTELVFDGGVPEGFDELVAAMPNLKTVVYSANPRYKAGWLQVAVNHSDLEFEKGEIPSEPQWYFSGEYLGDGSALDDPDGFAAVWPAPEGEVTVPFMWAQSLVHGISENAFKGCDKITKIRLPSCVCDLSLRTFDDCAALEAVEFYAPTREEYEAVAPYWEEEQWGEDDKPRLVRYYEPSYDEAFGEYAYSEFYSWDGLLMYGDYLGRVPRAWGGTLAVPNGSWLSEGALVGCSNVTRVIFSCDSGIDNLLSLAEAPTLAKVVYPGEPWLSEYWEGVKEEAAGLPELAGVVFEPMRPGETVWNAELNWGDGAYLYGDERYPAFWSAGETPADFVFPTFVNDYPLVGLGDNTLAGVSNLTSITLPYTVTSVGNLGCDLSGVTRLVFEGGVPGGFDELVGAASNLNTVVYSANPRYAEDWTWAASNHVGVAFVKGEIPSEPQWYVENGVLGGDGMWWEWDDASEEDVLVGFPCAWPAPEGAVEVPEAWAGQPICGIATGAFYGMDKITSLKLPRVEWIGEEAFRGCASLAAFEMEGPGIYCEDPSYFFVEDGVLLSYDEGYGWYPAAKEDADYELPHPRIVFDGCQYLETATVAEWMVADEYVSLATFATCPKFKRINVVREPGVEDNGLVFRDGMILADEGRELVGFTARAAKVTIPATVEYVRESAFVGMVGLSEVEFKGCLPSGLEAIAWACPSARIVYPSAPWFVDAWRETALSFAEDETLSNVVFAVSVPTGAEWCAVPEYAKYAGLYGFADAEKGYSCVWGITPEGALELPGSVDGLLVCHVSGDAFWGLTNLTSITFPYTVENVDALAQELPSVTELVFWGGVPSGLDDMLAGMPSVTKIVYSANPRFAQGWDEFIAAAAESHPLISFEQGGIPTEPQWYVAWDVLGGEGMWWEWDEASGKDVLVGFPCVWPAPEGAVEAPATWAGEPICGIATGAFYGMDKITSLKLPRVEWIGEAAFRGCASLAAFEMDEPNVTFYEVGGFDWYDNSPYYVENGVLLSINEDFGWYPAMREDVSYDMPYRNIIFEGCAYLETVTASAFWYDERPLTLGDFRTCPSFREVVVRDQKVYGGWYSFRGGKVFCEDCRWLVGFLSCGERASVTYPVCDMNADAFAGCRDLRVAVVDVGLVAEGYVSLTSFRDSPNFERIELAYDWPGSFEEKDGAFVRDGYELAGFAARSDKVVIPGCVGYVNDCAFYGLENLSEIVCPGAVPDGLESALLSAGVLPKISVSPNPRYSEGWAEFARMMKEDYELDVTVEPRPFSGETEWCYYCSYQGTESGVEKMCVVLCGDDNGFPCVWPVPEDGRLVIPETIDGLPVIGVSSGAFSGLTNLTAVTFPATVRYLEDGYFYEDCTNLTEVTMPCSMSGFYPNENARIRLTLVPARRVEGIGDEWALRVDHGVGLEGDCFCGLPALTEVTLAEGIWELGDSAFSSCPNLKKVTLPSSLWSIGWGAFTSCDVLQKTYFLGDAPVVAEDAFMDSTNFTAFVCAGTTGWSGIEGDGEIPAAWYAGYAEHPISGFDVDVILMIGAEVWTNLTVVAGTLVSELPFPTEGGVYANLGWYADEGLVQAVDGSLRIPVAGKVFYANRRLDLARHMNDGTLEFTTGEGVEAWYGSELTAPKGGAAAETETLTFPEDAGDEEFMYYLEHGLWPHAPWMETRVTGPCYFEYSVYRSPYGAETLFAAEPADLVVMTVDGAKVDARSVRKSASGWTTVRYLIGEGEHAVRWTAGVASDSVVVPGANEWMALESKPVKATVGDIAADAFGPRKSLVDWTEKLICYRSWNEGDLVRLAADEEAKFADDAGGYAAHVRHAYATLMQLGERPSFKDFCASAGLRLDYLRLTCDVDDADTAFGAGTAGVNETVDRVVAEDLPLIETVLADLEAIPTNWTGRILLTPGDYPIDEDVFLDQADLGFLRASLHGALAAIRYLAGYDLAVDWEKLRALRDDYAGDLKAVSNRGEIAFQRFRDEQAEFFSRSRDRASLAESREQVRAALAAVLAADRLATARADDELHLVNYGDQDEAASRRVRAVFDNLHLASESLDGAVDVDVEALWSQCGKTGVSLAAATGVDPSLLPNGWIARVYLGALFNGKINRKYASETYLDEGGNLVVRLETMWDPALAGLLPQMTIGCISNLVDRYYPGAVEHCEWSPLCTIAFETNGGSAIESQEFHSGRGMDAPDSPERTGYTFAGWFADPALTTPFDFSEMPEGDAVAYAKWTVNRYTVKFEPGAEDATGTTVPLGGIAYTQTFEIPECGFAREGWVFVGWRLGEESILAAGEKACSLCERDGGTVTLTAAWEEDPALKVYVTRHANFDADETDGAWRAIGEAFGEDAESCPFKRLGHAFAGWYTAAEGGVRVDAATKVADWMTDLYAHWQASVGKQKITTAFHGNGGEPAETNVELVVGVPFGSQNLPKFVAPDGKLFAGWFADSACQVAMATNMPVSFMLTDVYVGWADESGGPVNPPLYGPWGEGEVRGAAQQTPTTLFDVVVAVDGKPAAVGDCIRVLKINGSTGGEVCGYGKVLASGGLAMVTFYAEADALLAFDLWVAESGLAAPTYYRTDRELPYLAPEPGTDVQGGRIDFFSDEAVAQVLHVGQPDWNVISLAVDPFQGCDSPSDVFGPLGADVVQVVRGGRADSWRPGSVGTLKKVERGVGYWIRTNRGDLDLTVHGTYDGDSVPTNRVVEGWNLLGYPFLDARDVEAALKTALDGKLISAVVDGAKFFAPDSDGGLSKMRPGRAYWVLATRDGEIACDVGSGRRLLAAGGGGERPAYGPWGDDPVLANPDRCAPTLLTIIRPRVGNGVAADGDCIAAYRKDDGALCGVGRVAGGEVRMVCYAPTGAELSLRHWSEASGLELPVFLDAANSVEAPETGSVDAVYGDVLFEGAGFGEAEARVAEGSSLCVRVRGGDSLKSTMVSVGISYLTAAAADLDLAKMTVDGVPTKKFPVTLRWEAGETGEKEIVIPVEPDKTKEGDERFLLQLYDPVKLTLGEATVCTVTIDDRTQGGVTRKDPYVSAIAVASDGGSVSGSGYLVDGKKVTLKAKAAKNFRFAGWYPTLACASDELVCTEETLVVDRTGKETGKPGKQFVVVGAGVISNVAYYARFERQADKNVRRVSVAYDAARGKVTGAGYYPIRDDKAKVTVKATAAKGYVFVGWYDNAGDEAEFAGECLSQAASYVLQGLKGDVDLAAKFESVSNDMEAVAFALDGISAGNGRTEVVKGKVTRTMDLGVRTEMCGVPVSWPITAGALTPVSVTAAKLPSGLKLVKTAVYVDPTARKKVVDHYEWSVEGVPTAASKAKRGAPDVLEPSHVVFTVTTAGRSAVTVTLDLAIEPLPAELVGTYDGVVADCDGLLGCFADGIVSLTVKANGGVSGKFTMNSSAGIKALSFTAKSFTDYYAGDGIFVLVPEIKLANRDVVKPTLYFSADPEALGGRDQWTVWTFEDDPFAVEAVRNVWSDKPALFPKGVALPAFQKNPTVTFLGEMLGKGFGEDEFVTLKFGAKGKVTVSSKFYVTDSRGSRKLTAMTGSAQLMLTGFAGGKWLALTRVAIPAKKNTDFEGFYRTLSFEVSGGNVNQSDFDAMEMELAP